jgi:hypothetical protein
MAGYSNEIKQDATFADGTEVLARKGFVLQLMHIPSGQSVTFKAILTQFADTYSPSWKEDSVYGRMDKIANFNSIGRTITIGWDMVAATIEEAQDNLAKQSQLARFLYPSYSTSEGSGASAISASPLLKLSFVNWVQNNESQSNSKKGATGAAKSAGLVGYINSPVAFAPVLNDGFFDPPAQLYPVHTSCNITFVVLHVLKTGLGWDSTGTFRTFGFPYGLKTSTESKAEKSAKSEAVRSNINTTFTQARMLGNMVESNLAKQGKVTK